MTAAHDATQTTPPTVNLDGAVLLLVDMQRAFDEDPWPPRWNKHADANASRLLAAFRRARLPVLHVRHDSVDNESTLAPGKPGNAFRPGFEPQEDEQVVAKSVNAAFIGTDLDLRLRRMCAQVVVICGISTDMCVSTTVRVGANLGWSILLVGDACDCFDLTKPDGEVVPASTVHDVHLATLGFEFCTLVTTRQIVAALGPSAKAESVPNI